MAKYQWRLEFGTHFQEEVDPADPHGTRTAVVYYRPGDIIDTDSNLGEQFNSKDPLHPKKFQRIDYSSQQQTQALAWIKENQPEAYAQYLTYLEQRNGGAGSALASQPIILPGGGTKVMEGSGKGEKLQAPAGAPRNQSLEQDLRAYTLRELQAYAETNEIDVEGLSRKEDVLQKILAWHSSAHAGV